MRSVLVLFITGSALGSLGDYFHKAFGITIYPSQLYSRQVPGLPIWTIFLFGAAGVLFGFGYQMFKKYRKKLKFRRKSNLGHAVAGSLLFLGIYAFSALIGDWSGPLPDILIAAAALGFWFIFNGTKGDLVFAVIVGLAGTLTEIILVHAGFFFYGSHIHKIFGVASWLPWLYVAAAVAAADISQNLKHRSLLQFNK